MLWTGWPAAQIRAMQASDIDWRRRVALVRGRRKGRGPADRRLPLLPQAVAALRALRAAKGFGPFSTSAVHSCLHRACKAAKVRPFRPYDLRHLFAATIARLTTDDRVVAELLMHTSLSQARRYTEHSVSPRLTEALATVEASFQGRR